MSKKSEFETLQLHVGQEQPDPTTDSRAIRLSVGTKHIDDIIAVLNGAFHV